jgi:hypothetical protein
MVISVGMYEPGSQGRSMRTWRGGHLIGRPVILPVHVATCCGRFGRRLCAFLRSLVVLDVGRLCVSHKFFSLVEGDRSVDADARRVSQQPDSGQMLICQLAMEIAG